jgi:phosphate ABC transporter phosphate-binding protein
MTRTGVTCAALLLAAGVIGCGKSKEDVELKGAGSSFINPLMKQWMMGYERTEEGRKIDYRPIGSSLGMTNLINRSLDFACTDKPLDGEQLEQAESKGGPIVHVPLALGGVVAAYNVPEARNPLRLSGEVLAGIYLGTIKKWNDPPIAELNKDEKLPDKEIVVVRRRDGSGTTFVWTEYLSKVSKDWEKGPGRGTEISWSVSHKSEDGNSGVADAVRSTPYAIGYCELTYALRKGLPHGLIRNRAGKFIACSPATIEETAAAMLKQPGLVDERLRFSLTDATGAPSYPLCSATWALAYVKQPKEKRKKLIDFLSWILSEEGEQFADELFYARITGELKDKALEQVGRLGDGK